MGAVAMRVMRWQASIDVGGVNGWTSVVREGECGSARDIDVNWSEDVWIKRAFYNIGLQVQGGAGYRALVGARCVARVRRWRGKVESEAWEEMCSGVSASVSIADRAGAGRGRQWVLGAVWRRGRILLLIITANTDLLAASRRAQCSPLRLDARARPP